MKNTNMRNTTGTVTTRSHKQYVDYKHEKIICNLHVGEHLKQIRGLEYFKTAYDYKVVGEYTHHYLIAIKYTDGQIPDYRNYIHASISKVAIYCGNVVLVKDDGSRVVGHGKWNGEGGESDVI